VRISAFPLGLLDLLYAQNFGQNPGQLADTLVGQIDVTNMLFVNRMEGITTTGDVVAAGANSTKAFNATVPAGEVWIVHRLSILVATAAGEAINAYGTLTMNGNIIALTAGTVIGASNNAYDIAYDVPIWLPPGSRLGIWGTAITGAPTGGVNLVLTRLSV